MVRAESPEESEGAHCSWLVGAHICSRGDVHMHTSPMLPKRCAGGSAGDADHGRRRREARRDKRNGRQLTSAFSLVIVKLSSTD